MDAQTAINEIIARKAANNPMTVDELRALAKSVDVSAGNSILLLYSGGVGEITDTATDYRKFSAGQLTEFLSNGTTVKTIADTQISKFLVSDDFIQALGNAANSEGISYSSLL